MFKLTRCRMFALAVIPENQRQAMDSLISNAMNESLPRYLDGDQLHNAGQIVNGNCDQEIGPYLSAPVPGTRDENLKKRSPKL